MSSDESVDETVRRDLLTGDEAPGEDFSEEDYESDYSDDEPIQKSPESFKKAKSAFVDVEATVDRDDEEEMDDENDYLADDFIDEREEAADYQKIVSQRQQSRLLRQLGDDAFDAEAEAERIKQTYGPSQRRTKAAAAAIASGEMLDDTDASYLSENMLMPTVYDPKLWLVKCKPGHEKELCINLLRKYFNLSQTSTPLFIKSAMAKDNLKGYIYIEAFKLADVLHAIKGFHHAYESKIRLVPIHEMTQVMNVPKREPPVQPNTWARIKRGKYIYDLVHVVDINKVTMTAFVRLVPRLDIFLHAPLQPISKDKKLSKDYWIHNRAPAKLFDPKQVSDYNRNIRRTQGYWIYNGEMYTSEGHLEKEIKWSGLLTPKDNMTPPSLEEVTSFLGVSSEGVEPERVKEALSKLPSSMMTDSGLVKQQVSALRVGDIVEVISGDLAKTVGILRSLDDEKAQLLDPLHQKQYTIPLDSLRKQYRIGDSVRIVSGRYAGRQGLLTDVKESLLSLFCESTQEQLQVWMRDVSDINDKTNDKHPISESIFKKPSLAPTSVSYSPAATIPSASLVFSGSISAQRNTAGSYGHAGTLGRSFAANKMRRDPYLDKLVIIAAGPFKGQLGLVKESDGVETLEIELQTTSKQVSVLRNCVTLADGSTLIAPREEAYSAGGTTPFYAAGSKTPGMVFDAMTPGYGGSTSYGSRTPGFGARTPADTMSVYSAVDVSNKTPGWSTGARSVTNNPYGSFEPTPKAGVSTPTGWNQSTGSATPMSESGWKVNDGSSTPIGWKASEGSTTPSGWKSTDGAATPSWS